MKTIQSIKATKNVELGQIKRVDDREADSEVRGGYWKYIPKSEWKASTRKLKTAEENTSEKKSVNSEPQKKNKGGKNIK